MDKEPAYSYVDKQLRRNMTGKAIEKTQLFRNITGATELELLLPEISSFAFFFLWSLRI